jgi:hypothetical protein
MRLIIEEAEKKKDISTIVIIFVLRNNAPIFLLTV